MAADLPLTLEQAWQLAEQANPMLKSAQANLAAAEGQLADAQGALEQSADRCRARAACGARSGVCRSDTARVGCRLTQTLEIAGQQGYRRTAAEQELAALRETIEETAVNCAPRSSRSSSAW
jgi:cobalt-zinc-cadmium efflux system outer membrane protein